MLVNCYICGSKIPNSVSAFRGGKVICDECRDKYYFTTVLNPTKAIVKDIQTQIAKADAGKPNLSLVPKQIIYEIEKVRRYGTQKYKDKDNWKKVELERYHQALLRHTLAIWNDIGARDKESDLLHLSHIACNVAFILELMREKQRKEDA